MGIANSVDLPFRKKHSAMAMKDCQLLFEPYSADDVQSIVEMKINKLFHRVVPSESKCEGDPQKKFQRGFLRNLMHNLIDERALTILSKKIAQSSGDIRVAFDIMKTALEASLLKVPSMT